MPGTVTHPIIIRIKKNADATAALTCVRADGSTTWHSPKGAQGRFFALHDLTHYAAETALHATRGFYGLISEGWDISDFGPPWPRGPLPPEALWIELIVGFLDMERAASEQFSAIEWNDKARLYYSTHGGSPIRDLHDDELNAIRDRRDDVFSQWAAVSPGRTFELTFPFSAHP
jgi:hypothetical protein